MQRACLTFAPILLFVSVTAHAQEDAGVEEAETGRVEPAQAQTAPAPAEAIPPPPPPKPHKSPAYDPAQDARYRGRIALGAMLELGGLVALISSLALAMDVGFGGFGSYASGCGDEEGLDYEECVADEEADDKRKRTTAWVLMPVGAVAIVAGLPLIFSGAGGHRRQKRLKKIQDAGPHVAGVSFAIGLDGGGGLAISGSF